MTSFLSFSDLLSRVSSTKLRHEKQASTLEQPSRDLVLEVFGRAGENVRSTGDKRGFTSGRHVTSSRKGACSRTEQHVHGVLGLRREDSSGGC